MPGTQVVIRHPKNPKKKDKHITFSVSNGSDESYKTDSIDNEGRMFESYSRVT